MTKKYYLTTPIYYVNDVPHIGHAYTTIIADMIARYYNAVGCKSFFLTGSDEHGSKILESAKKNNLEPKEFCDRIVNSFKNAWKDLSINYDKFIRTSDEIHEKTVSKIYSILYEKKDIYKKNYIGLYCINCEKYITDSELSNGLCPDHGIPPIKYTEENYFFRLSKYQKDILRLIENNEIKILPKTRKNEILGKLQLGLEDISISRKSVPWGIPLPFDPSHTAYVWIDALVNYLSGIDYFRLEKNSSQHDFWPCDLHLIGKDILWFHAVVWPGILLSSGIQTPKTIFAHGYFTVEGKKMSKSVGNVLSPNDLINIFGSDATRYLLLTLVPLGQDGDFSWDLIKEKYNRNLADNLGNLVSRTFAMIKRYYKNEFEAKKPTEKCFSKIKIAVDNYKKKMNELEIHLIPDEIFSLSNFANIYIQSETPWILERNNKRQELQQVLSDLSYLIKACSLLLYPLMPNISEKINNIFNEKKDIKDEIKMLFSKYDLNIIGRKYLDYEILFKKI